MAASGNTLDDFPAESYAVLAFCERCRRQRVIDRAAVPRGLTIQALRTRLRCSACGSRETSLRILYTGAGGFRHGVGAEANPGQPG